MIMLRGDLATGKLCRTADGLCLARHPCTYCDPPLPDTIYISLSGFRFVADGVYSLPRFEDYCAWEVWDMVMEPSPGYLDAQVVKSRNCPYYYWHIYIVGSRIDGEDYDYICQDDLDLDQCDPSGTFTHDTQSVTISLTSP
jgi:hypothetical protein